MKYPDIDVDIRDVQLVELEILLEFDRICKKHGIPYQLFAGTLLGAIRHKGFIPWDDDIDVCMLRKDYDNFIAVCNEDLDIKKYFLQTCFSDPKSIVQFAKLRKNNTIFINKVDKNPLTHTGIYIDIFPMDNVKPDAIAGDIQLFLFKFLYALTTSTIKERVLQANNKFIIFIRFLMFIIMKLIPKNNIDRALQKTMRMFYDDNFGYISLLANGVNKDIFNRFLFEKSIFSETIKWEFEGSMFSIPKNYDLILTKIYGDYLELPSQGKRFPHHGVIKVEFN